MQASINTGNKMKIVQIGISGTAANNRMALVARGLVANGIICEKLNACNWFLPNKRLQIKYLKKAIKISYTLLRKLTPGDIVYFYAWTIFTPIEVFIARLRKCDIFFERNEYPYILRQNVSDVKIQLHFQRMDNIFYKKCLKHAKGFITCSTFLENYYKQFTPVKVPFAKFPLFVDYNRFSQDNLPSLYDFKYIAYCGYMGDNKDGVSILIDAFKIIAPLYKINLVLIGTAGENIMQELQDNAKELENRVVFTGHINHENMPQLLQAAEILVLSRPDNKQAEGGFPSKLGEYLATGKPVIVTKVGDIPSYIQDGINGFLAKPDSAEDFAEKIKNVLDDYENALQVGKQGQEFVKNFDFQKQGLLLKQFLLDNSSLKTH